VPARRLIALALACLALLPAAAGPVDFAAQRAALVEELRAYGQIDPPPP